MARQTNVQARRSDPHTARSTPQAAMKGNLVYELPERLMAISQAIDDLTMLEGSELLLESERDQLEEIQDRVIRDSKNLERAYLAIGIETPRTRERKVQRERILREGKGPEGEKAKEPVTNPILPPLEVLPEPAKKNGKLHEHTEQQTAS